MVPSKFIGNNIFKIHPPQTTLLIKQFINLKIIVSYLRDSNGLKTKIAVSFNHEIRSCSNLDCISKQTTVIC